MTFEEYNNLTDIQKEFAHMFIRTTIEFASTEAFNNFISNPAETYFKLIRWDAALFIRNYKSKPYDVNKYTEKVLNDALTVYDLLDVDNNNYYRESSRKRFIENFLMLYTNYTPESDMLMDEALNKRLIECLKSDRHESWDFPRTKVYKETTIKRMKMSPETYLENCEFLKPYYNTLRKKNPELKDDGIKLVNEVSGGVSSTKPTLYNTTRSISKDIYKYPMKDLSKYYWNVSWYRAVKNEKTVEYLITELSKPFDPEIDYKKFYGSVGYNLTKIRKTYEIFRNQFELEVYNCVQNKSDISIRSIVRLFNDSREYSEIESRMTTEDIANIILKYYGNIKKENIMKIIDLLKISSIQSRAWYNLDLPDWCYESIHLNPDDDKFLSISKWTDIDKMIASIKHYEDLGQPIPVIRNIRK